MHLISSCLQEKLVKVISKTGMERLNNSESKYNNTAIKMDRAFLEILEEKDFEFITVKEICKRAEVNRSTFYLHYETIADLLDESLDYINEQFLSYFDADARQFIESIHHAELEEINLITPKYLVPYLRYIKDHQRIFRTSLQKNKVLKGNSRFNALYANIIEPILNRNHVAEEAKIIIFFYYHFFFYFLLFFFFHFFDYYYFNLY